MDEFLKHNITGRYTLQTWLALILGIVALVVYANTFTHGFVLDDYSAIVDNRIVTKGVSAIPEIFGTPYLRGHNTNTNDLYRPLSLAMFAAEHQLTGGSPLPGHVINVLLFAGCVVLLFLFFDLLFDKQKTIVAFIASVLFAVHPIHTEVVANIKSRDELLCFFFAFLSLITFITYTRSGKPWQLAVGAACLFLSLLSKETSITFIFIIPLVFFFYKNGHGGRSTYITIASVFVAFIFLSIRFAVLNAWHANDTFAFDVTTNSLVAAPTFTVRLATAILMLGNYLKLLFIPYPLVCDYSYNTIPLVSFGNAAVMVSLAVYFLLIVVSTYRVFKLRKDMLAFGLIFFLITLALFANIFFLVGATMAERFLFFPSAGFCLAAALAIYSAASSVGIKFIAVFVLPIVIIYAALTINRSNQWKDALTLYSADVHTSPNSSRLHYYLGNTLLNAANEEPAIPAKNKLLDDGITNLKKALTIFPAFPQLNTEIGNSYLRLSNYDSAELYINRAIASDPRDTFSINNLAALYFKRGKYRESLELCRHITLLDPTYARGYRNMGSCYLKLGANDSAIIVLKKAIELQPGISASYHYLSVAYKQSGNFDSSTKYEAMAR